LGKPMTRVGKAITRDGKAMAGYGKPDDNWHYQL
jgi:hypothetical protein